MFKGFQPARSVAGTFIFCSSFRKTPHALQVTAPYEVFICVYGNKTPFFTKLVKLLLLQSATLKLQPRDQLSAVSGPIKHLAT